MDGDRALQQGEIGESEGGPPAGHPVGHEGTRVDVTEREAWSVDGFAGLAVSLLLLGLGGWMTVAGIIDADAGEGGIGLIVGGAATIVLGLLLAASLTIVAPGQTGSCSSSAATSAPSAGRARVVPFTTRERSRSGSATSRPTSSRSTTPTATRSKIAAIVVWQVADTARRPSPWRTTRTSSRCRPSRPCGTSRPATPTTRRRGGHPARRHRVISPSWPRRSPSGSCWRGWRSSSADSATGLCRRDRPGDAAAAAGRCRRRRPRADRRRGGRHGREALARLERQDIVELDAERKAAMVSNLLVGAVRRTRHDPVVNTGRSTPDRVVRERGGGSRLLGEAQSASRCCSGSTLPSTTRWPAGPRTTCAASTPRSSCCCAGRSRPPGGCRVRGAGPPAGASAEGPRGLTGAGRGSSRAAQGWKTTLTMPSSFFWKFRRLGAPR